MLFGSLLLRLLQLIVVDRFVEHESPSADLVSLLVAAYHPVEFALQMILVHVEVVWRKNVPRYACVDRESPFASHIHTHSQVCPK